MIAHIDKVIRHLRSQIETANKMNSEFIYITRREAEACLELAEAQEVIQETFAEQMRERAATPEERGGDNGGSGV